MLFSDLTKEGIDRGPLFAPTLQMEFALVLTSFSFFLRLSFAVKGEGDTD